MRGKKQLEKINLKEALDLAIQVELEAMERYHEFARQIGSNSTFDASEFFLTMADNEKKHAKDLQDKRFDLFGRSSSSISLEDLYEFQEIEAPEFDRAESFMSTKKALLIARDCEIKAYDFFDKAIKVVTDKRVVELFSELREEEVEHRKMIEKILDKLEPNSSTNPTIDNDDVDEPNGL